MSRSLSRHERTRTNAPDIPDIPGPLNPSNAPHRRSERRRSDPEPHRPEHAEPRALVGRCAHRSDHAGISRRDVHGAGGLSHRSVSRTPRHRRQRVVQPRRRRGPVLEAVERARAGAEDLGRGARGRSGVSRARTCSGGSTCTRRPTTRSRRDRCIRPTGASCPTCTRRPAACATTCSARSARFRSSSSGDRARRSDRREWIAASARHVEETFRPTLSLVYLPHLDYNLQRAGLDMSRIQGDLADVDRVAGDLIAFYEARGVRRHRPVRVRPGDRVARRCISIACFGSTGSSRCATKPGSKCSTPARARAFAVADHQVAHVYVNDRTRLDEVRALLHATAGVDEVLGPDEKRAARIDHPRAGDFVVGREAGRVVHLLLLERRRARAGFRANGGYPPEARLRSGGAVSRSGDSRAGGDGRLETRCSGSWGSERCST